MGVLRMGICILLQMRIGVCGCSIVRARVCMHVSLGVTAHVDPSVRVRVHVRAIVFIQTQHTAHTLEPPHFRV